MVSESVIQRICFINYLWIISEGLCTQLEDTVYLYSFVLNLVLFYFLNKYC